MSFWPPGTPAPSWKALSRSGSRSPARWSLRAGSRWTPGTLVEKARNEQVRRQREAEVREMEEYEEALQERASRRQVSVRDEEHLLPTIIPETAKAVLGQVPRGKITPLREAALDMGSLVVWGEIFSVESKETRDKARKIYSIDITDYTGSTTLKIIQDARECQALDKLKAGTALLVRGEMEYDKYDRENVMRPRAIATVELVKVVDDALEKRVELHLHTSMSDMDGMTPAAALIKQAHQWGQKAVAITDHGVAQAFPEAMNTVEAIRKEDPEFKVLYGTEAYFVNDLVPAVSGGSQQPLSGDFICFDLETTFRPERPHYGNRRGEPAQRGNHRPLRHLRGPGAAHPGENHPADLHHQRDGGRRPQGGGGFRAVLPVLRGGRRAGGPQRLL